MKQIIAILFAAIILIGCNAGGKNEFTVAGKITNSQGKMVYLEEVPVGTMQPTVVDSATLQKDGTFSLKTKSGESIIYNIRVDNNNYPIASVINDVSKVEVNVTMNKNNGEFADQYEVKGSPASEKMKDFMVNFNGKLQSIYAKLRDADSLHAMKANDSLINAKVSVAQGEVTALKEYALSEIKKTDNPALTMFELGYYQSTANNTGFGIEPLANEQVLSIIDDVLKKHPNHAGIGQLKQTLVSQSMNAAAGNWTGKQAPDFTLPDENGKPVSLSSLKGKYVLVDFWASWCKPCRMENPTVVAAYNKYKDKNFTILGVSLDENKEAWLAAIKKDQLTWQHVSDLKQWNSMVLPIYKFNGIPYNILIDPQGKVIAEELRGPALEAKLAAVLK